MRTTQTHKKNYWNEHRGIMSVCLSGHRWLWQLPRVFFSALPDRPNLPPHKKTFFFAFVTYTTETRLLLDFSLKSEHFWSVLKFFFLNKSVWRQICKQTTYMAWCCVCACQWKLEVGLDVCIVVSTEICKFVYTKFTSPIRLFSLFSPFVHFKWDTLILFFHFPVLSFYFSCACVSQ